MMRVISVQGFRSAAVERIKECN